MNRQSQHPEIVRVPGIEALPGDREEYLCTTAKALVDALRPSAPWWREKGLNWAWRGQWDSTWPLLPSAFREQGPSALRNNDGTWRTLDALASEEHRPIRRFLLDQSHADELRELLQHELVTLANLMPGLNSVASTVLWRLDRLGSCGTPDGAGDE